MLDQLFAPLTVTSLFLATNYDRLTGRQSYASLFLCLGVVALWGGIWVVSALADSSRYPNRSNGFESWAAMPDEKLRPPAWLRRLVFALSPRWRNAPIIGLLSVTSLIAAHCVVLLVSNPPEAPHRILDALVSDPVMSERAFLAAGLVLVSLIVESWAARQRSRLEPAPPVVAPDGLGWAFFIIVLMAGAGMAHLYFGGRLWMFVVGASLLLAIGLSSWRGRILDALFGKRISSEGGTP